MAYKSLYRTYRPQRFEEVAGQQHIVKTLKNAIATGKIAHAYLFTGPRGTGKTSMAKLFAKALNCEQGIGCQCNECRNCKAIIDGSHPDVLELDAASNNGVDEIRDLIDKVKYGTILGRYKVYIIDEVHMLSTGAFNALLKTLEEPPEHVVFILATTEPHKILPTILSRCQRYDFEKLSEKDIKNRIRVVLAEEKIDFNEEAINLIVKLADGGMRDALSILEKVLAYSGNTLNLQDVLDIFSLETTDEKINLLTSISNHDLTDVLNRLHKYVESGSDIKRLTEDLLTILKDVLIYSSSYNADYLEILNEEEATAMMNTIPRENIMNMINILMETLKDYKNVSAIIPLFEIALLKLSTIEAAQNNIHVPPISPVKPTQPKVEAPKVEVVKEEPVLVQKEPEIKAPTNDAVKLNDTVIYLKDAESDDDFKIDDDLMIKIMVTSKKDIKNDLIDRWPSIRKYLTNPLLGKAAGLLIDGRPLVASNKVVVLEFQLASAAEKVNLKNNQLEIQTLLQQIFGRKMFVYAVSRSASIDLQSEYMNQLQLKQLPKPSDVVLEFEGE